MIGTWQLVLIFAIVLVLFGAGRIPKIMRDLGVGLREFKRGINEIENDNEDVKGFDNTSIKKSNRKKKIIKKKSN